MPTSKGKKTETARGKGAARPRGAAPVEGEVAGAAAADEAVEDLVDADDAEDPAEEEEVAPDEPDVVVRPPVRTQSNRPPSARDEPPPPFNIGERIILTSNVRPLTGSPISDHPVGAPGRVETVLSQTAIVRFDRAPERKEVVAFTCLESTDLPAQARRRAEAKALAKAKKAAEDAAAAQP